MPYKMSHLSENLRRISATDPELARRVAEAHPLEAEVVPSRVGRPTLKLDGAFFHSAYDPAREAADAAAAALERLSPQAPVVVLGLGLGYLAEEIHRRRPGRVAVVEPDAGMVRLAAEARRLDFPAEVTVVAGVSPEQAAAALERRFGDADWERVHLVPHPPSVRRHPDYFAEIERLVNLRRHRDVKGLGILVATPIYGGSLPVARFCAEAFRRLGHRVEVLDNEIYDPLRRRFETISGDRRHRAQLTAAMAALAAESVTARALDRAVDLVWCVAQSPMSAAVLGELKRAKIPAALWFVEDWKLFSYWREWAPRYDYFFTIQRDGFHQALQQLGVKRFRYLPLAADPQVHRPMELPPHQQAEFGADLSHVGAGYRNRRKVFAGLADLGLKIWGNDWDDAGWVARMVQRGGARLDTADTVKVFNATRINLNLHSSAFHDGVNPDGDYVNPRTFEIASCGAFQLVDHRRHLSELFRVEPGSNQEMVTFADARDIPDLVRYYLDHPAERRAIADRARQRVLAEHTYEHRMAQALQFIYAYESEPAGRRSPNHLDHLLAQAQGDPELENLLRSLRGRGVVTVDDAAQAVPVGSRDLTEAEAALILTAELRRWGRDLLGLRAWAAGGAR